VGHLNTKIDGGKIYKKTDRPLKSIKRHRRTPEALRWGRLFVFLYSTYVLRAAQGKCVAFAFLSRAAQTAYYAVCAALDWVIKPPRPPVYVLFVCVVLRPHSWP